MKIKQLSMDDIIHEQEIRNIVNILENLKLNETRNIKGFDITYIGPNAWPNDGRRQYKYQEYVSFEAWMLAGELYFNTVDAVGKCKQIDGHLALWKLNKS